MRVLGVGGVTIRLFAGTARKIRVVRVMVFVLTVVLTFLGFVSFFSDSWPFSHLLSFVVMIG